MERSWLKPDGEDLQRGTQFSSKSALRFTL
jgi:hypothetical protein